MKAAARTAGPSGAGEPPGRPGPAEQGSADHENTLPLGGRVEGNVRLHGERGRGVGGADRETSTQDSIENSSVDKGTLSRATPTRRVEGLMSIADRKNREGSRASGRGMHLGRLSSDACRRVDGLMTIAGGRLLFRPSTHTHTHTQAKYHQPYRSRGGGWGVQACIWDAGSGN